MIAKRTADISEFVGGVVALAANADSEDDPQMALLGMLTLRDIVGTDSPFDPDGE